MSYQSPGNAFFFTQGEAFVSGLLGIVRVSGSDARSFLQGQLTQDLPVGEDPAAPLAAWCNPKGRVIAVVRVMRMNDDEFLLGVPSDLADTIARRLLMFRFRARVEVTGPDTGRAVLGFSGEVGHRALAARNLLPGAGSRRPLRNGGVVTLALETGRDPRLVEVYGSRADFAAAGLDAQAPLPDEHWERTLIDAGIPTIKKATTERFTPHMLNLDLLGAISFSKGCYTGQEVIARTEHLGRSKRRLMRFLSPEPGAVAGDRLLQEDREVGEVVNAVGQHLLAVVPVPPGGEPLRWNGRTLLPEALPYSLD